MCLAVPSKVVELDGEVAIVEAFGQARRVSLLLMPEEVALGDYVLIQAGGFAFERVKAERERVPRRGRPRVEPCRRAGP